jgi:chemotaxis protein CheD
VQLITQLLTQSNQLSISMNWLRKILIDSHKKEFYFKMLRYAVENETTLKRVFVVGGNIVISKSPQELVTILGSCVSVCLWDKKTGIGAMNHFLLPELVNAARSLEGGIESTRMMIQTIMLSGASIKNLEARIYGGSNRFFTNQSFLNVGPQNVVAAKFALSEAGIKIIFQDTGGVPGRKIYFNTQTGVVLVEKVNYTQ